MTSRFLKCCVLLGALIPGAAPAQQAAPDPRLFTVSISPIHLSGPVLELTGEYRILPKASVALIGGFGSITANGDKFSVLEGGGQARFYPFKPSKHQLNFGVESLWLQIKGDDLADTDLSGTGAGLAIGPFVGYKYVSSFGLTFDGQFGFQFVAMQADASDGSSDSKSTALPLLNLNVGWSF